MQIQIQNQIILYSQYNKINPDHERLSGSWSYTTDKLTGI